MKKAKINIVIDTNIWVSFLIGQCIKDLKAAIINDIVCIQFSEELYNEMIEVLQRPKFSKYFSPAIIKELIFLLSNKIEMIEAKIKFSECRDEKDNFLLDLCDAGNTDYLITGDKDLLVLNPFNKTKIISFREFEKILDDL